MKKLLLFMMLLVSVLLFTSCEVNTQEEKKNNDVEPIEVKEEEKKSVDLNSSDPFPGYTREMFGQPEPTDEMRQYNERRWYLKIDDFLTNDYYILSTFTTEKYKEVRVRHVGPYLTDENIELMKGYLHYTNENMDELEQVAEEMMLKSNPDLDHIEFLKFKCINYYDGEVMPLIKFIPVENENMRNYMEFLFNTMTKEKISEPKLPKPEVEEIEIK